jgi:hypothetical protein
MVTLPPDDPELEVPQAESSATRDSKRQLMKKTLGILVRERCKSARCSCDSGDILDPPLDTKRYDDGAYGDDVCTKVPAPVEPQGESLFSTAICCPFLLSALLL